MTDMTPEAHRERHQQLHKALDELLADYIGHHGDQPDFLNMPIRVLMEWSYQQTKNPDEWPNHR
jgi:hypothetical protein